MKEALALSESIRVGDADRDLGLHESPPYDWRSKARPARGQSEAAQKRATENARLQRQLALQTEEPAIVRAMFKHMEEDHNQDRRHSANGNLSPARYDVLKVA